MEHSQRNRWWLVAAMGLVLFMSTLDMNIVTVALPSMEEDFGTRTSLTEWVTLGYMLALMALVLPAGRWLDSVGKRAALVFAVTGFAVTSALAGAAPGVGWLIAARVFQGVFAAIMLAQVPVLATLAVRPEARGRAMGIVVTLGPLGAVCGPALGGVLVGVLGWPFIFYLNIPVSLAVIAVVLLTMPADGRLREPRGEALAEAAVVGGAVATVLLALSLAPSYGPLWLTVIIIAVPLLAVWLRMPQSRGVTDLLRQPGMAGPHGALFLAPTATLAVQFLAPFYLRDVIGVGAAISGVTLLAFPLAMAGVGPVAGALADRYGAARVAMSGVAVLAVGFVLVTPLRESWSPLDLAWRLAVAGIGSGVFAGPVNALAMARAPGHLLSTTGASTNLARTAGFTFGPAVATGIWAAFGYSVWGMRASMGVAVAAAVLALIALATSRVAAGSQKHASESHAASVSEQ